MSRLVFTVTNDLNYDQRMIKICTSLTEAGFDVLIIGLKKSSSKPLVQKPYRQKRLNMWFGRGKLFYLEGHIRIFFSLLFAKANIVCAIDMDTLLPCFIASRIRGLKLVFDSHEYYSETSGLVARASEKRIWSRLEEMFIPKLEHAYTVNESLAQIFQEKFGVHFDVIRNLPHELDEEEADSEGYFLYQGVLNKGRGLEELIEVFKTNTYTLKIAGDGPLMGWLKDEVHESGIEDRVQLLGWKNPDELKRITSKSFCGFNLIERTGKSYYYSLANKFFDYMQAGIPQIGMNYPEYARINGEHQVSILINDFSELPNAIESMINSESDYQRMKMNCRSASKEFVWEKEEGKLIEFYNRLASIR